MIRVPTLIQKMLMLYTLLKCEDEVLMLNMYAKSCTYAGKPLQVCVQDKVCTPHIECGVRCTVCTCLVLLLAHLRQETVELVQSEQ